MNKHELKAALAVAEGKLEEAQEMAGRYAREAARLSEWWEQSSVVRQAGRDSRVVCEMWREFLDRWNPDLTPLTGRRSWESGCGAFKADLNRLILMVVEYAKSNRKTCFEVPLAPRRKMERVGPRRTGGRRLPAGGDGLPVLRQADQEGEFRPPHADRKGRANLSQQRPPEGPILQQGEGGADRGGVA